MKQPLIFMLWLVAAYANGQGNCSVHPMLDMKPSPAICDELLAAQDSDQDGHPDWKVWQQHGGFLVPDDPDIDNDGIPNQIDVDAFQVGPQEYTQGFPSHLLKVGSKLTDRQQREWQLQLFRETGLYFILRDAELKATLVSAFLDVTRKALPQSGLESLRYVYITALEAPGLGYYVEPLHALVLNVSRLNDERLVRETIAHEIGHAVVFSKLTPDTMARLAQDHGGWSLGEWKIRDFYSRGFMRRFSGQVLKPESFPSTYSYVNVHEWFAENFARYIMESEASPKKLSSLQQAFQSILGKAADMTIALR